MLAERGLVVAPERRRRSRARRRGCRRAARARAAVGLRPRRRARRVPLRRRPARSARLRPALAIERWKRERKRTPAANVASASRSAIRAPQRRDADPVRGLRTRGLGFAAMGRPASGSLNVETLADGTRAFQLRFRVDGRREHETLHERRGCACGCGGGWTDAPPRSSSRTSWRACRPASGASAPRRRAARRAGRDADLPRLRVGVAGVEGRRRARRSADRHEHRERLPLAARRGTSCRSSASTGSTRSTPSSASRSRRTSSARPPSSARRSPPAPSSATRTTAASARSGRRRSAS